MKKRVLTILTVMGFLMTAVPAHSRARLDANIQSYIFSKAVVVAPYETRTPIGEYCYLLTDSSPEPRIVEPDTVLEHKGVGFYRNSPFPVHIEFKNTESILGMDCAPGEYLFGGDDSHSELSDLVEHLDGYVHIRLKPVVIKLK